MLIANAPSNHAHVARMPHGGTLVSSVVESISAGAAFYGTNMVDPVVFRLSRS